MWKEVRRLDTQQENTFMLDEKKRIVRIAKNQKGEQRSLTSDP